MHLNAEISGAECSVVGGKLVITSDTPGNGSSVVLMSPMSGDNALELFGSSPSSTLGLSFLNPAIYENNDIRIKLKNMDNKSIGRNYIDVSGNRLVSNGVGDPWLYLTNNLIS